MLNSIQKLKADQKRVLQKELELANTSTPRGIKVKKLEK
jgi:hypothetical protein